MVRTYAKCLRRMLTRLAEEFNSLFIVVKVNNNEQRELAGQYGIQSLPTVKIFRHGSVVDEFLSVRSRRKLFIKFLSTI
uniref:Putative thioredoxin n=1 Tax=Candidatus Kentrum sp. TC TaxID=2126339 RepID=A0A450ZDH7_9GAMM|nr:MAG: putative thioredoxin [Candidatus Kentron sp. TC]VFK51817.1 MAG: putative thioredoxin [Candidatus Kentron sp. TC]VFK65051.1 MAG: putative thioredoxin [Candidatus Kentron sp. TC]